MERQTREETLDNIMQERAVNQRMCNDLKITSRLTNIGGAIGGITALVYSQIAHLDPLPEVVKGVAYGIAIPYAVLSLSYYFVNQVRGTANDM